MIERWCEITGYEGLYQVSNFGNVRSVEREVKQGCYGKTRVAGGFQLTPTDNGGGYLVVTLRKNGERKNFYVHRLVAAHFIENEQGYKYINHKDYDTHNNRFDNLEWCTQQQNIRYSSQRMRKPRKSWKLSATKEKYIYIKNGRYRLSIHNKIDKLFPTLEEAVQAREVVLSGK